MCSYLWVFTHEESHTRQVGKDVANLRGELKGFQRGFQRNLEVAHLKAKRWLKTHVRRTCTHNCAHVRFPAQARPWKCRCDQSFSSVINKRNGISRMGFNENFAHTHTDTHTSQHLCCPAPPHSPRTVQHLLWHNTCKLHPNVCRSRWPVRSPGQTFPCTTDRDGMTAINPTVALHTVGAISPRTQRHKCTFR